MRKAMRTGRQIAGAQHGRMRDRPQGEDDADGAALRKLRTKKIVAHLDF